MDESGIQAVIRTLLLSDLVGSTRLVEELGDRRAAELFARHDRLARDLLPEYGGLEIDKTDGFLMLFQRPIDALLYAIEYHRKLAFLREESGFEIAARVGIHLGEVYLHENTAEDIRRGAKPLEVEGLAKPMAARIMSLAEGNQTLLTRGAFDLARRAAASGECPVEALSWLAHGAYLFKGVSEAVEVFEVGVEGEAPLSPPPDSEKVHRAGEEGGILGWRPSKGAEIPTRKRWQLEEQLGEGGFGEVWLAVHKKTGEKRVFKFCFDAGRLRSLQREVTLFRVMKESLGNRPDIARILDWNFEESPYFIETEFSEGGDLLQWLEGKGPAASVDIDLRLELLAQVADALAAAHSVGVLHKDIKPSNVLIRRDLEGEPKILLTDFGIGALMVDAGDLGITMAGMTFCESEATSSGTSLYMAPELFEGRPPSVQADMYSLGVLSYQLLSGHIHRALAPGWERDIDSEILREDLAAMVDGKPERRLADAGEAARRFRSLHQRQESREAELRKREDEEKLRKTLRRTRRRRKLVSIVAAALAVVALAMAFQAHRISVEARRAEREARTAEEVRGFLESLFEISDPESGKGKTVTAREVLDAGAAKIQTRLEGEPVMQARMMDVMGRAYLNLGLYAKARPLLEKASEIQERELGRDHPDRAGTLEEMARLQTRQGYADEALQTLDEALRIRKLGGQTAECGRVYSLLAEAQRARGRFDLALEAERKAEAAGKGKRGSGAGAARKLGKTQSAPLELEMSIDLLRPYDSYTVVASGVSLAGVGERGVDILDRRGLAAPVHENTAEDERILDSLPDGRFLVFSEGRVLLRYGSWIHHAPEDRTLADHVDPNEHWRFSQDGASVARFDSRHLQVYDITGLSPREILRRPFSEDAEVTRLVLDSRYCAWATRPNRLRVVSLDSKKLMLDRSFEGSVEFLALDDRRELLAVGGWMDEVYVIDLQAAVQDEIIRASGRCYGLEFLQDFPSLVIGRQGSLQVWRAGKGIAVDMAFPGEGLEIMGWVDGRILVQDFLQPRLLIFSYASFPLQRKLKIASAPIWAMVRGERRIYAGSADGSIIALDPGTLQLRSRKAHDQGVTELCVDGNHLVSASDDKTLAIWKLPGLEEDKRTKAHRYLVNALDLDLATSTLFSTSSDGSLKTWSWPALEEKRVFSISRVAKGAVWIDSNRGIGLLGSWDHHWYRLRRQDGEWISAGKESSVSQGTYRILEFTELGGALILGLYPSSLVFVDGMDGVSKNLPLPEGDFSWILDLGGGHFLLPGSWEVAEYRCRRENRQLSCSVTVAFQSDWGDMGAAAYLPEKGLVAAGSAAGEVALFNPEDLPRNPLMSFSLDLPSSR